MTSLLNLIKIYQLIQNLLVGDTHRQHDELISLTVLFKDNRLAKNRLLNIAITVTSSLLLLLLLFQ
jgi:hypothetical protein